jgi:small subunit ribosomal protein S2
MAKSQVKEKTASVAVPIKVPTLVEMLEAGVHFGHERSKQNPKMKSFVFTQRNRIGILDLEKTQKALEVASEFAYRMAKNPAANILFVGTKRQARKVVQEQAQAVGMPFVTKRWLGGTLTNFATVLKSIEKLEELKSASITGELERRTKKEQAVLKKEMTRLETVLEGMRGLRYLPNAIFAVGVHDEKLAVHEAKRMGIPIIGIVDTNADPNTIDYPIPANDDAVRSVTLVVTAISQAISLGRQNTPNNK